MWYNCKSKTCDSNSEWDGLQNCTIVQFVNRLLLLSSSQLAREGAERVPQVKGHRKCLHKAHDVAGVGPSLRLEDDVVTRKEAAIHQLDKGLGKRAGMREEDDIPRKERGDRY